MIVSLLYLTTSEPYLLYSVGIYALYQAYPKESHLIAVKKIIKYVSGTTKFDLWYSHDSTTTLMGYCDADWAGNSDDRKSTLAEAEYIVIRSNCSQLISMKSMLQNYGVTKGATASNMTLYCHNLNTINISKNPVQLSRTKHIDIQHHFIRSLVEDKFIELKHVPTKQQLAHIFTKRLDASRFETLRTYLGLCIQ